MAPEALLEKENEISEKTDVYAFGLLYDLFSSYFFSFLSLLIRFWEILTRQKVFLEYDKRGDLGVSYSSFTKYLVSIYLHCFDINFSFLL